MKVFISYAHANVVEKEEVISYAAPLVKTGQLAIWSDRQLGPGLAWRPRIQEELANADLALLLVSEKYLESGFCMDEELPILLARRIPIVPLILSHCLWREDPRLANFLALPADGKPLSDFSNRGEVLTRVWLAIKETARDMHGHQRPQFYVYSRTNSAPASHASPMGDHINASARDETTSVISIEPSLRIDRVNSLFRNARRNVRVLQTWIGHFEMLQDSLSAAVEAGARVQLLLLHEDAPAAAFRAKEMGFRELNAVSDHVRGTKQHLARFVRRIAPRTIEIRQYDTVPSVQLYAADQLAFLGLFWYGRSSLAGSTLEVDLDSPLGKDLLLDFDTRWADARPCLLE